MNYKYPPINEVSYGIRYKPLDRLSSAYYGRFWAELGPDFVEVSDQAPVMDPPRADTTLELDVFARRVWIVHKDRELLLQIQPDRFYMNWRRQEPSTKYPGYEVLHPLFQGYLGKWLSFLEKRELGTPAGIKGLLSYVNQVQTENSWDAHKYFRPVTGIDEVRKRFPDVRGMGWSGLIVHEGKKIVGELKTFQKLQESQRILQLEVRAEAEKELGGRAELEAWFSSAHDDILSLFDGITTEQARAEWSGDVGSK